MTFANNKSDFPCRSGSLETQSQCLDQAIIIQQRNRQSWVNKLNKQIEKKRNYTGNIQLAISFQRNVDNLDSVIHDNCQWRYLNELPNINQGAIAFKRCELKALKQQIEMFEGKF